MIQQILPTPVARIPHSGGRILAKLEWFRPTGSTKDRAARAMLAAAQVHSGSAVVEATSGNTGISLAALSAERGYRCTIVMPENMSRERIELMKFYGAQVILTSAREGMAGARRMAGFLAEDSGGCFIDQFHNPVNPQAHYETTGPEILAACGGVPDYFVAGVGTGGTITGVGKYLKERDPAVRVIGVIPAEGQLIPGIGAGFLPPVLEPGLVDGWIRVTLEDALAAAKRSGLGCGISSGAALHAAKLLADRAENAGKTIATILPDSIERYLSEL